MVSIMSLWLPILLSAILVFIASSVIHMVLTYHKGDWRGVPQEDAVMDALRAFDIPPGDYAMPHVGSSKEMSSPEFKAKSEKGPVAMMTFYPPGGWNMGSSLALWFVYSIVVGVFAAYVAGIALGPGAEYLSVMQVSGTVAFCCYAMSMPQNSIWFKRGWGSTLKTMFDGLVYGLLTGGTMGWLWPAM